MRSRSFIAVAVILIVLFGGAGALLAYDSAQSHAIADGITVGGVPVGGLSVDRAAARVRAAFAARLHRPVIVTFHRRRFVLRADLRVDASASARQALARTRSDNLLTRAVRSLTGGRINANIEPQLTYSTSAITRFSAHIAHSLDRRAHDATLSYSGDSIGRTHSQSGVEVQPDELTQRIESELARAGSPRPISVPVIATKPRTSAGTLAARYPTIITVDRSTFTLRLWKHLKLVRSYRIAVGMAGLETPAGLYHIQQKQVNPSWQVPNSAWAGALAGRTIPPGPQDPIKARWMGIYNGAGIHGTDELSSLGSAASHGCIRMAIPDVIALYDQTPLGTPVYIA